MQNGLAYVLSRNGRFGLEPNSKDRRSDLDIEVLSVYLGVTKIHSRLLYLHEPSTTMYLR